jgi:Cys-tRNA(Pro)/Cys-tRNA(Cys) deacylase
LEVQTIMKEARPPKTLAMRVLEGQQIAYEPLYYDVVDHLSATEVAAALGLLPEQTFKTLVALPATPGARPVLALLPANAQLDLKKLAAAAGEKKMQMALQRDAERLTGLEKGGISPLALLDRGWPVFVDETVILFDHIEMSAGRKGVGVLVPVEPVLALLHAVVVALAVDA